MIRIFILNLAHREDRRDAMKKHLDELGLLGNATFVDAVQNTENPEQGCAASHLKAIRAAKNEKLARVLVLEDDARIRSRESLVQLLENLEDTAHSLVFLGITRGKSLKLVSPNFVKLKFAQNVNHMYIQEAYVTSSHAILYNLSDEIFEKTQQCLETCVKHKGHIDLALSDEFSDGTLLVPVPFVADFAECGESDVRKGQSISTDIEHLQDTEKKLQQALEKYYGGKK